MKVPGQGANEKASGAGTLGDDPSLRKFLRLAGLGLAWLILMAFQDVANSRPPSLPKSCYEVLREHPEIPETEYIVIVRDNARDYRLRECAGQDYAIRHPESVKEFIKLLFEHPDTVRIAIDSLRDMGPSARPAVPFLISLLESDQKIYYHSISLKNALASIGVVDRESIDRLLDMAITKRPNPFIAGLAAQILSSQKTLPAYVGDVVTAALEKNGDGSREYLGSLYQILIPVRIPQAVERRVERAKAGVLHDGRVFNKIGAAAILALIDNSREHVDLESRVFSIIALMKMKTAESVQAGKRLAQEMLPLLEQSAETQMRLTLIQTLKDIKYTDALPTMRRLADGDHDAEVRSAAAKYVEALKGVELCHEALEAFPGISEAEYLDVAKDKSRHYRLRVCAGEWYAARHPEWLGKFIELLFDHEAHLNTPLFAIQRLKRMGPGARSAVPLLISALDRARDDKYADDLSGALISIGVVERESIDQLLDMAITKRVWRYVCLKAEQVLASQKTLPAHVGDVVIARIDKGDHCASLYPILIPVRTPQAIKRYVKWTKESVVQPGFLDDYQSGIGDFKYAFQRIGPAAIPVLVDDFRKSDDLDSRAFSVLTLMAMRTVESVQAGRKLVREILSPLPKKSTTATPDSTSRDDAESRARKLEGMIQLLGRELLVYLYLADEPRMRLELIQALRDIRYTDALPALRRLAGEDRDAEVRAGAATSVAALERMLENTADIP